jgi:hypothetical protein
MATAQRLIIGPHPVAQETPPTTPEAPHVSGLDADHIAALHAQAAGLHNIRSIVSIVLDLASSHYSHWRGQVILTLRRYALTDHVLDDIVAPPSSAWSLMDTMVLSWLHGTITVELQNIIRDRNTRAVRRGSLLRNNSSRIGTLGLFTSMLSPTSSLRGASPWRSTAAR